MTTPYRPNPVHDYFTKTNSKHPLAAARNKLARILWGIAVHGTPCNWPTSQPQGAPDHD